MVFSNLYFLKFKLLVKSDEVRYQGVLSVIMLPFCYLQSTFIKLLVADVHFMFFWPLFLFYKFF